MAHPDRRYSKRTCTVIECTRCNPVTSESSIVQHYRFGCHQKNGHVHEMVGTSWVRVRTQKLCLAFRTNAVLATTLGRCSVVTSSWTRVDLKPGHLSCQDAVPSWQTHCRPCLYDVERMFYFQNIFCFLKTRRDHSSVVWVAKCKSSNLRFFGCQKKSTQFG